MIEPDGRNLIFLFSAPRSGSTLLGALLGNHSRVDCPPEPWLILSLNALRSDQPFQSSHAEYDLAKAALGELVDDELLQRAARRFALSVYNDLLTRSDNDIFVDKTPRNYRIPKIIDSLFPSSTQIWLRRNPLDVVASCKVTWSLTIAELTGREVSSYSFDTNLGFAQLSLYFADLLPNKQSIRYEDLVRNPTREMQELCWSIGLDYQADMIHYGANRQLVQEIASSTMGDKKILKHEAPHQEAVDRWRADLTTDEVAAILHTLGSDLFKAMGYTEEFEEACGLAGLKSDTVAPGGRLDELYSLYGRYIDRGFLRPGGPPQSQIAQDNMILGDELAGMTRRTERLLDELSEIDEANMSKKLETLYDDNERLRTTNEELGIETERLQDRLVLLQKQKDDALRRLAARQDENEEAGNQGAALAD